MKKSLWNFLLPLEVNDNPSYEFRIYYLIWAHNHHKSYSHFMNFKKLSLEKLHDQIMKNIYTIKVQSQLEFPESWQSYILAQ